MNRENFLKKEVLLSVSENEKHFVEVFFKFFLEINPYNAKFMDVLIFIAQPSQMEGFRMTAIFRKAINIMEKYFIQEDPEYVKIFSTVK